MKNVSNSTCRSAPLSAAAQHGRSMFISRAGLALATVLASAGAHSAPISYQFTFYGEERTFSVDDQYVIDNVTGQRFDVADSDGVITVYGDSELEPDETVIGGGGDYWFQNLFSTIEFDAIPGQQFYLDSGSTFGYDFCSFGECSGWYVNLGGDFFDDSFTWYGGGFDTAPRPTNFDEATLSFRDIDSSINPSSPMSANCGRYTIDLFNNGFVGVGGFITKQTATPAPDVNSFVGCGAIAAVPAPLSGVTLAAGLLGFGAARRRKSRSNV